MGAAASIKLVYEDAVRWFKNYLDQETYIADFHSIDKDGDNMICFMEFQRWIEEKASVDAGWSVFKCNPQIIAVAHKNACLPHEHDKNPLKRKVVDYVDFRNLLVHLFFASIMWAHFANADGWDLGGDVGNKLLNLEEFRLACITLCRSHAQEKLTDEQIEADFMSIDKNGSGSISFAEVCTYCQQYMSSDYEITSPHASKLLGEGDTLSGHDLIGELQTGPKAYFQSTTVDQKTSNMGAALSEKIRDEFIAANDVVQTENRPNFNET